MRKILIVLICVLAAAASACSKPVFNGGDEGNTEVLNTKVPEGESGSEQTEAPVVRTTEDGSAPAPTDIQTVKETEFALTDEYCTNAVELLEDYHRLQFIEDQPELAVEVSDQIKSDLELRAAGVKDMEQRGGASFVDCSVEIRITEIRTVGDQKEVDYTVIYWIDYQYPNRSTSERMAYGADHTVTIDANGTIVADIFNEEYFTGFVNGKYYVDPV